MRVPGVVATAAAVGLLCLCPGAAQPLLSAHGARGLAGGAVLPTLAAVLAPQFRQPDPIDFNEHDGWISMFDGRTLDGWSGDSNWRVEDGAIVVEPTCEKPTGTIYLVWQGGEAADFEMKLEMKGTGSVNSGVQYRGWIAPRPAPTPRPAAAAGRQGPAGAPAGRAGRGRGAAAPCPSGQPRGTPPSAESEAQWNMWGAQYRLRRRQPLHRPVLRAVDRPRDRGLEGPGRPDAGG